MRRFVALLVYRVPHYPFALAAILVSGLRLGLNLSRFRAAGIIVYLVEGGFGHTVTGPEAVRRFHAGKRPLLLFVSDRQYHNPLIATLYKDVDLLFLRCVWRVRLFGREFHLGGAGLKVRQILGALVVRTLRACTSVPIVTLHSVYDDLEKLRPVMPVARTIPSIRWMPAWWQLVRGKDLPIHLPATHQDSIRSRINAFTNRKVERLCCLYLRQKDISGRIGSPFEAYIPSIRLLIEKGYVVMITGDREPEPRYAEEFGRSMVCASYLKADPWVFDLFAATEAQIWVGDTGGGSWLSIINRIPMLVVNGFPYAFGVPGATMHYKFIIDNKSGERVHYSRLFRDHENDFELKGMTLKENTADEILAAVKTFIGELEGSPINDQGKAIMQTFPDYTLGKFVDTRLAEDYLRAFT
jgi:putative glycosyltransferase (TIGR04372 family)